jgi:hypothetical protein
MNATGGELTRAVPWRVSVGREAARSGEAACIRAFAVPESDVAGGWVGYVYAIVGCGTCALVALGSTLVLYLFGRWRGGEPRGRVTSVSSDE